MKLGRQPSDKLKPELGGTPLWFTDKDNQENGIFLEISPNRILFFQYIFNDEILEIQDGVLKYGKIKKTEKNDTKRVSRSIEFKDKIPQGLIQSIISDINDCPAFSKDISKPLFYFLKNKTPENLISESIFSDFNENHLKTNPFKVQSIRKKIITNVGIAIFIFLIAIVYNNLTNKNKLQEECLIGNKASCLILGDFASIEKNATPKIILDKTVRPNTEKLDKNLCRQGNREKCFKYLITLKIDDPERIKGLKKLCLMKHNPSCYILSLMSIDELNFNQASQYLSLPCKKRYKNACSLEVNIDRILNFWKKCQAGVSEACHQIYNNLKFIGKVRSIDFKMHCNNGHAQTCVTIKDFKMACRLGLEKHCE